jgi:hypothetical protein
MRTASAESSFDESSELLPLTILFSAGFHFGRPPGLAGGRGRNEPTARLTYARNVHLVPSSFQAWTTHDVLTRSPSGHSILPEW